MYEELKAWLRGELLDCHCAAYGRGECCCRTIWPEDACQPAADAIEQLERQIAERDAELQLAWNTCGEAETERDHLKAEIAKYRDAVAALEQGCNDSDSAMMGTLSTTWIMKMIGQLIVKPGEQ